MIFEIIVLTDIDYPIGSSREEMGTFTMAFPDSAACVAYYTNRDEEVGAGIDDIAHD